MTLTADQRSRYRELYFIAPFLSMASGVIVTGTRLGDWALKQVPSSFVSYADIAMRLFPVTWLIFTLGCAFGTSLEDAWRIGMQGWKFAIYVALCTTGVFIAQAGICGIVAMAGYAFLNTFSQH